VGLQLEIILGSASLPISDLHTSKQEIVLYLFHLDLSINLAF